MPGPRRVDEQQGVGGRARRRRLAMRVASALVVLVGLALVVLHSSWAKETLRVRAEAILNERVAGAVSIASLDYGFLFSDLTLRGVEVRDRDDNPAVAIVSVEMQVNRWASLRHGPDIDRLNVSQMQIDLRIDEEGNSNLRGLLRPAQGAGRGLQVQALEIDAMRVQVTTASGVKLAMRNGRIRGSIRQGSETDIIATELFADLHMQSNGPLTIKGQLSQGGLRFHKGRKGLELGLQTLRADLQVGRGDSWQEVEVGVGAGSFSLLSGKLLASLEAAVIGPVRVGAASAELELADGFLQGPQHALLSELHIDATNLGLLLGTDLQVGQASGQLELSGPAEAMALAGSFEVPEGKLHVTGEIDAAGPEAVSFAIETTTNLRLDELGLLPGEAGALRADVPTRFRLDVQGAGLPFHGGQVALQLQAIAGVGGAESTPLIMRAHLEHRSVKVDSLKLKLFGAEIEGDGRLNTGDDLGVGARLTVHGNAREAMARLEELGIQFPPGLRLPSQLSIKLALRGNLDERVILTLAPSSTRVAGGEVMVLGHAVFAAQDDGMHFVSARGSMSLDELELRGLARLVGRRAALDGTLSGSVDFEQTRDSRKISHRLRLVSPTHEIELRADGTVRDENWQGKVTAHGLEGGAALASLEGRLPLLNGLGLRRGGRMDVRVTIPTTSLNAHRQRLPAALQARLASLAPEAEGELHLELHGSPNRPSGQVALGIRTRTRALPDLPLELVLTGDIRSDARGTVYLEPTGEIRATQGTSAPLLLLTGEVSLAPSAGIQLRERVGLHLDFELPSRPLASLAMFSEARGDVLRGLPGDVHAHMAVRNTLADPRLEMHASVEGMANLAGSTTRLQTELLASRKGVVMELQYGASDPVRIKLEATRAGQRVRVQGQVVAQRVPLAELLPDTLPSLLDQAAHVDSDLELDATLALSDGQVRPVSLALHGPLRVALDRFALATTSRSFRNIELLIQGKGEAVTAALQIEELDGERDPRRLAVESEMAWPAGSGPGIVATADARLRAHRWLLFGGPLGKVDAPRATLDADLSVSAALGPAVPIVNITVNALTYSEPDRENFTHGLETFSPGGDIVFTDDSAIAVGKLGPATQQAGDQRLARLPPALLRLHLPTPIEIAKGPLQLSLRGDVELPLGHGEGPSGSIEVVGGSLELFRELFLFKEGMVNLIGLPSANLYFSDSLPPDVARKLSRASAGTEVVVQLRPLGGGPIISFQGAGNADMIEALSLIHTGQPYFRSEPDAVASSTVRAPRGTQPLTIAFVKANIPRLHLFDRFAAWSNAYDTDQSYGQLRYLDAEKRLGDGSTRLRLVARPEQIGRSIGEAQIDRLFIDSRSLSVGVGARAGSRFGGGVGVFLEWSSAD